MALFKQTIPDEPHARRVLALMDRHVAQAQRNEAWYGRLATDESIALVLVDPESRLDHPVMRRLERDGLHGRNRVLALNPFDEEQYQEPQEQVFGLPLVKARIMRQLAQLLGATEFSLDVEHKTEKSSTWKGGVDAAAPKGGGAAMIHQAMRELVGAKATVSGKFSGGDADIEKASALLERACLSGDGELQALLHAARHSQNRVLEHVCRIGAVNEATRTVELAARAKVPGVLECKGDFKSERSERTEYRMNLTVKWADR